MPMCFAISGKKMNRFFDEKLQIKATCVTLIGRIKPLIHSMVRAQTSRLPLTDIIGGIGYIFGIMGLILYFKKREK